jgi:hypothetical protein
MRWTKKLRWWLRDQVLWLLSMPRQWLRNWLGVAAYEQEIQNGFAELRTRLQNDERDNERLAKDLNESEHGLYEKLETLEAGQNGLEREGKRLEGLIRETGEGLQAQIVELGSVNGPLVNPAKLTAENKPQQIDPGFRRFTSRKKDWEAAHRKPLEAPAAKQIEENSRLIASGTRKPE